jgi:glucosamine--fructose-6-phosphate aminotransferase (isomerizing)
MFAIKSVVFRSLKYHRHSVGSLSTCSTNQYSNGNDGQQATHSFGIASAIGLAVSALLFNSKKAENCGIVGVVGSPDAGGFLIDGLTILKNRGYDSAGVATITTNELEVTKFASRDTTSDSIDLVRAHMQKHAGSSTGVAHTRWATHGGKTDLNAHPHTDAKNRIALVHNGTINNSYDLRRELQANGVKFVSETDTEVIAQLVGIYLDKGCGTKEAVEKALERYFHPRVLFIYMFRFI